MYSCIHYFHISYAYMHNKFECYEAFRIYIRIVNPATTFFIINNKHGQIVVWQNENFSCDVSL